jgi:two-component system, chemotaxis family, chemotaxis protein CheY
MSALALPISIVALVDDDKIYQFTTERMLRRLDETITLLWFKNGKEAIDYLAEHHSNSAELPGVVILDINMPLMNGWEFLDHYQRIQESMSKPIEIYMMSSSIDERDMQRAREYACVTDYVEKPITTDTLRTLLHRQQ